jgi:hypothetical protein
MVVVVAVVTLAMIVEVTLELEVVMVVTVVSFIQANTDDGVVVKTAVCGGSFGPNGGGDGDMG